VTGGKGPGSRAFSLHFKQMSVHYEPMSKHVHGDFVKTFTVEKKPGSLVIVTGEIPYEELAAHEGHVLSHLGHDIEIKGFRKGHVPENVLRKHIGELTILSETAEHILAEIYPDILKEHAIDAIGRPQVAITKLAPGNPFGFTITITVLPSVTLADYKAAAAAVNKKKEEAAVTDAEVTEAVERIQRQKLAYDRIQEKAEKKQAAGEAQKSGLTLPTPETVGTQSSAEEEDLSKLPLPALTDEYVKTLGEFSSVDDFKIKVKEHLTREKANEATSKHRASLTDAILEGVSVDLPQLLIDSELTQMFGQMEEDLKRAGLTLAGYLEHVKKTREELIAEWTPAAEKRAKTQLVLNEIAGKEKIEPNKDDVVKEMGAIMTHYKDADVERVRVYVESVLRNNAVMKFLEAQ
jgi:trigger factor